MKIKDLLKQNEFVIIRNERDKSYCRLSDDGKCIQRVNYNQYGIDIKILMLSEMKVSDLLDATIVEPGTYQHHFDMLADYVKEQFGLPSNDEAKKE